MRRSRGSSLSRKQRPDVERMMFTSGTSNTGTLMRSTWKSMGGIKATPANASMDFPTLKTDAANLQRLTTANTSFVIVANNDTSKRIVLESFEATWNNPAGATNPKAVIGTVAQEGETSDLFVWMCSYISGHWVMNTPITLDPGKDLIHYNVKGPGQNGTNQPAFFKVSYHLIDA